MTEEQLAAVLEQMGCPQATALEMARQLDKRAQPLAREQDRRHEDALAHLWSLMKQGWAAQAKEL